MALDKDKLSTDIFNAFSSNTELTDAAKAELKAKSKAIAAAIDDFVKSAEVTVDIPVLQVATSAGAGSTLPGQGISSAVN